ncbi:MAG TPA: glycosyltransferase [Candidatus Omnitrophota bacterium]|nr:glycosyltransferase [Candidatus Omnitrophota bacterium]HNQ50630.1 glycosyltransferase [Candidatus Omnitrophota bacterium]HQO37664.1 glycosyltransferase [Candidatus Omnitrophota bacterium]HQQ06868.1 glycosyltransferase [Candidatus Omnitrophota bacterium]
MSNEGVVEVSVVMPCLNEERGIGRCIRVIKDVFARENINGEIIVADNGSIDRSVEIARSAGALVVHEPVKGYGAAYLRGLRAARGRYIIIGDSDNTYDFNDIPKFLEPLRRGCDFVMGSRFKGIIHAGAMPWAHRYIGNPILSGMTRLFFHTKLSDIHCGMRAFSRAAFERMRLQMAGMEFATEMVVSAINNDLKVYEVPIHYFRREGVSKLKSFADAWRHVRFMLLFCPVWLYFIPGISGFVMGMVILLLLAGGPVFFLGHLWDMHPMIFAAVLSILSYQLLHLGIYAHTFAVEQGFLKKDAFIAFFQRHFNLERGIAAGLLLFCVGLVINILIFAEWFHNRFGALYRIRESILAMTLLVIGLQTLFSSFFISLLSLRRKE